MASLARRVARPGGTGWVRVIAPLALGGVCLWLLSSQLETGALAGLGAVLAELSFWQWAGAALATAASFAALGQYDVILHRHLRTDIPSGHARLSGAAAIAIGQTVGLGILSGALVRWRLLPGLNFLQATKLATGVALTFLIGLSFALGLAALFAPAGVLPAPLPLILLFLFALSCLLVFLHPHLRLRDLSLRMPSLRTLWAIAGMTLLDTVFAAMAFWCLLPDSSGVPLAALAPVYMVALGAAILSGTPGGVGPFELVLVALLPQVPDASLLATIVAFRMVYYAAPAVLAGFFIVRPLPRRSLFGPIRRGLTEQDLSGPARAEAGLCRQAGAEVLMLGTLRLAVIRPGQTLAMLFGPLSAPGAAGARNALDLLSDHARREGLVPLVYKADGAFAAAARRLGWRALHVADDMILSPAGFRTEGRDFRQLRRKLRQAEQAGVSVARGTALPWADLRAIDADWQARQGAARGMTMGRFCPVYLSHQAVFIARKDNRVVGFASFHIGRRDWCLDLMRAGPDAPEGTMHALITAAIAAARAEGIATLSLAALPPTRGPVAKLAQRVAPAAGLAQFKQSFAPARKPCYALARSRAGLWLGLLDLWLAIRRPAPGASIVPAPRRQTEPHDHHEDYGFARARNV